MPKPPAGPIQTEIATLARKLQEIEWRFLEAKRGRSLGRHTGSAITHELSVLEERIAQFKALASKTT